VLPAQDWCPRLVVLPAVQEELVAAVQLALLVEPHLSRRVQLRGEQQQVEGVPQTEQQD
jgi:hypothetical protein